jgi:hypothetical protein
MLMASAPQGDWPFLPFPKRERKAPILTARRTDTVSLWHRSAWIQPERRVELEARPPQARLSAPSRKTPAA